LLLGSFTLLLAGSIASVLVKAKKGEFVLSSLLLIAIAAISLYLLLLNTDTTFLNTIHIYPFSTFFIMLFSLSSFLVNILSYKYSANYLNVSMFLSFSLIGMYVIPTATTILAIFIGLELIAIPTTFMIMLSGKKNIEAAVKFFLLSSIAIAVFSFAIALIYPYDLQLSLSALTANPLVGDYLITLAIIFAAAALAFDAALFPFNFWAPDVYEGSPTNITAMLAGINKKVAFVALMQVFFIIFVAYKPIFSTIFVLLSVLTMFFGNIVAIVQKSVKRMFAYSSISQAGYILIGFAAATQFGLQASVFQIFAHAFMIIGAFALILWLESKDLRTIADYTGLHSRNKFAAAAFSILMLSMAGIPPLIGFDGKFLLFSSAISANLVLLALIGIINSFISIYYYGKVISSMYSTKEHKPIATEPYVALVVVITLVVIIVLGIYPQPLISLAQSVSSAFGIA
jgi:NADH-quinone oxidoreductase subunit N